MVLRLSNLSVTKFVVSLNMVSVATHHFDPTDASTTQAGPRHSCAIGKNAKVHRCPNVHGHVERGPTMKHKSAIWNPGLGLVVRAELAWQVFTWGDTCEGVLGKSTDAKTFYHHAIERRTNDPVPSEVSQKKCTNIRKQEVGVAMLLQQST